MKISDRVAIIGDCIQSIYLAHHIAEIISKDGYTKERVQLYFEYLPIRNNQFAKTKNQKDKAVIQQVLNSNILKITSSLERCMKNSDTIIFYITEPRWEEVIEICGKILVLYNLDRKIISLNYGLTAKHTNRLIPKSFHIMKSGFKKYSILISKTPIEDIIGNQIREFTICGPSQNHNNYFKNIFRRDNLKINLYKYTHTAEMYCVLSNIIKIASGILFILKVPLIQKLCVYRRATLEIMQILSIFWIECEKTVYLEHFGIIEYLDMDMEDPHFLFGAELFSRYPRLFLGELDGVWVLKYFYKRILESSMLREFPFIKKMHDIVNKRDDPDSILSILEPSNSLL